MAVKRKKIKRKNRNASAVPALYRLDKYNPFRQFNRKETTILARAAVLLSVLLITWVTFGRNGLLRYLEVKKELAATISRKEAIQGENKKLRQQIAGIQDDPEYLEKVARQQYHMTRENEILFSFD